LVPTQFPSLKIVECLVLTQSSVPPFPFFPIPSYPPLHFPSAFLGMPSSPFQSFRPEVPQGGNGQALSVQKLLGVPVFFPSPFSLQQSTFPLLNPYRRVLHPPRNKEIWIASFQNIFFKYIYFFLKPPPPLFFSFLQNNQILPLSPLEPPIFPLSRNPEILTTLSDHNFPLQPNPFSCDPPPYAGIFSLSPGAPPPLLPSFQPICFLRSFNCYYNHLPCIPQFLCSCQSLDCIPISPSSRDETQIYIFFLVTDIFPFMTVIQARSHHSHARN